MNTKEFITQKKPDTKAASLPKILEQKEAVIFDLDGTLTDSMGIWHAIDVEYLGRFGLTVPDDLQAELEGMSFTETALYFKQRFSIKDTPEEIKNTWNDMAMDQYVNHVCLKPGIAGFLKFLKERQIPMAVASSNSIQLIEATLKSHGIREYFQSIVTGCQVAKGKPAPDVYLEAARQLQVNAENCLVFEDIVQGIHAGKNAGMEVCAVADDYSFLQEKEKRACADYFIHTYEQITDGTYEEL